jgi:hypothetical protein
MKLKTIWTLKGITFYERRLRTKQWLAMTTAAQLPQEVRYWATLIELGKATSRSQNVMGTPLDEILQELQERRG